jgi:hypothetical protein
MISEELGKRIDGSSNLAKTIVRGKRLLGVIRKSWEKVSTHVWSGFTYKLKTLVFFTGKRADAKRAELDFMELLAEQADIDANSQWSEVSNVPAINLGSVH